MATTGTSINDAVEKALAEDFSSQPTWPGRGAASSDEPVVDDIPDDDPYSGAVTAVIVGTNNKTRSRSTSELTAAVDAGAVTPTEALAEMARRGRVRK